MKILKFRDENRGNLCVLVSGSVVIFNISTKSIMIVFGNNEGSSK